MRSRTFLNVSLGILALAAAYHLGAQSAGAQVGGFDAVEAESSDGSSAVIGRQLYTLSGGSSHPRGPLIPGTAEVVACCTNRVVLANGEAWILFGGSEWRLDGIFPVGATASANVSFGSLKASYRGEGNPLGVKPSTNR